MKKLYSIGLLLLVLVLAASLLVACGTKEETATTVADDTATTVAATATTVAATVSPGALALTVVANEAAVNLNTLDLYGIEEGNNVLMVWDVPVAGSKFPILTSGDYPMTIEALDAGGTVLGTIQIVEGDATSGKIDYSAYAATAQKIKITTSPGTGSVVYEYLIP